jgi:hypothetical protein
MSKPLQDSAMLVTLTVSQWTARKHDKTVSNEVDKAHAAKDAGRYNKLLISKEALDPMEKITGAARAYLYKMTHAWGDNGERLLPAALFFEFSQTMQQYRNEFDARVRDFVASYPQLVQDARVRLGTLYDPKDYPTDIRSKFSFPPVAVSPVPSANDFRVNLNAEYVDSIKAELTERMEARQRDSLRQCWGRVREVVTKMTERLGNEKSPLYDSLITNARELIALLPALNLTNDAELNAIAAELQSILVPIDRLRQDKRLRADTAAKADAILAKLPWAVTS